MQLLGTFMRCRQSGHKNKPISYSSYTEPGKRPLPLLLLEPDDRAECLQARLTSLTKSAGPMGMTLYLSSSATNVCRAGTSRVGVKLPKDTLCRDMHCHLVSQQRQDGGMFGPMCAG